MAHGRYLCGNSLKTEGAIIFLFLEFFDGEHYVLSNI